MVQITTEESYLSSRKVLNHLPLASLMKTIFFSSIRVYAEGTFYNYCGSYEINDSKDDSRIECDFGDSKKVDLSSYYIMSNCSEKGIGFHPKSWRILGSNDKSNWDSLDKREGDNNLYLLFKCQESKYGEQSNSYRYIRYTQDDNRGCNDLTFI